MFWEMEPESVQIYSKFYYDDIERKRRVDIFITPIVLYKQLIKIRSRLILKKHGLVFKYVIALASRCSNSNKLIALAVTRIN
jgi:hypothetical protein